MPLNKYFVNNQTQNSPEQKMLEDIWVECIKITGTDAWYIIRNDTKTDLIYGEDPLKTYTNAFPIEIYNSDITDFQGQKEIFSKFGLEMQIEYTVLMARRSFLQQVQYDPRYGRPREGDLLWIPHVRGQGILFEITFCNPEKDFFVLGRKFPYYYELKMEPFKYSQELIQTGVPNIDAIPSQDGYTQSFILTTGGTGQYIINEVVYQGSSLTSANSTAYVASWDNPTYTLNVTNIMGTFTNSANVIGSVSGANYQLSFHDTFGAVLPQQPMDNEVIFNESQLTEIFNEINPLGIPGTP